MMKFSRTSKPDVPRRRSSDFVRPAAATETQNQFRRNQTIGNIRRSDGEPVSERARVHNLTRARQKITAILALVLGIIIVLTLLMSQFTARAIVTGSTAALSRPLNPGAYEKVINEYLAIHPVERLRFALDEDALSAYVSNSLPEVSQVSISGTKNIVEANFRLELRKPIAGWQINSKQFYVDTTGVVFQNNYYDTPGVQIIDQSGVSPEQGTTVASARLLSFVGRVVALSGQGSYTVTQAILPSGTTRQIEIRLKDIQPLVKLSIDRGAGEQVEDMIRSLTYLQSQGKSAQYIDVRVEGRAVYL